MGKTFADTFDSYVNWIILFIFLTSVNLAMEASAYLLPEPTGAELRAWALWPARAASLTLLVATFFWLRLVWYKRQQQSRRALFDEFVTDTLKRSAFIAFFLTLCLVAILDVVTNNTQLPADFFIKLPGLSLTAGFSVSYFLINFFDGEPSSEARWV